MGRQSPSASVCRKCLRPSQQFSGSRISANDVHTNGEKYLGQASVKLSMIRPANSRLRFTATEGVTRGPDANRLMKSKLRTSSAVSNTAGITVEKQMVHSR